MRVSCLECGKALTGKQTKFCCPICKARWWNRRKDTQARGFETLKKAFEKLGYKFTAPNGDREFS